MTISERARNVLIVCDLLEPTEDISFTPIICRLDKTGRSSPAGLHKAICLALEDQAEETIHGRHTTS